MTGTQNQWVSNDECVSNVVCLERRMSRNVVMWAVMRISVVEVGGSSDTGESQSCL